MLKKADRFKEGSRFSTWLYQIALNLCRDQARRRRRWRLLVAEELQVNEEIATDNRPDATDPAANVVRRELSEAVLDALRRIPAPQREVLILKEFEGLKFKEIAEILECPESTVKSRMYVGLSGLRSALEHRGVTGL